jgi:hypothetical protein
MTTDDTRHRLAAALHPVVCWNAEFGCNGPEDHLEEADELIAAGVTMPAAQPEGPGVRADALHRAWVENGGDWYYGPLFWEGVVANFSVIARYAEQVMERAALDGEPR